MGSATRWVWNRPASPPQPSQHEQADPSDEQQQHPTAAETDHEHGCTDQHRPRAGPRLRGRARHGSRNRIGACRRLRKRRKGGSGARDSRRPPHIRLGCGCGRGLLRPHRRQLQPAVAVADVRPSGAPVHRLGHHVIPYLLRGQAGIGLPDQRSSASDMRAGSRGSAEIPAQGSIRSPLDVGWGRDLGLEPPVLSGPS